MRKGSLCLVDLLGYLGNRKKRLEHFQEDTAARKVCHPATSFYSDASRKGNGSVSPTGHRPLDYVT